ncbi:MAG: glycosyltransferase [Actinobacteria bacterium]|nr:glycosyltransferase [Actinomycetota bacterium]
MSEPTATPALPLGVNLAGYLDATVGIGEAARHVGEALRAAGVAVAPIVLDSGAPRRPGPAVSEQPVHPVTIVCVNPDGMTGARDQAPAAFEDRHVIGLWWWEVDALPQRWTRAFDLVDEVWAGSRFVADALAAISPVPVVHVPLPVPEPLAAPAGRAELGLPEGFLYGFVYDYAGVAGRKNPLGLIEAYARAVAQADRGGVKLVLKSLGGDGLGSAHHREVLEAAEQHDGVTVIDGHMSGADKNALIRELDCFVSLHRSEGFGLSIAEAMLLGTAVVATDYGGSRDFVTSFNALPVDYRAVTIGPGNEPYPAGGTWAEPDLDHAASCLRAARRHPRQLRARAARARADVLAAHAPAVAGRAMADRLARVLSAPHDGAGRRSELAPPPVGPSPTCHRLHSSRRWASTSSATCAGAWAWARRGGCTSRRCARRACRYAPRPSTSRCPTSSGSTAAGP